MKISLFLFAILVFNHFAVGEGLFSNGNNEDLFTEAYYSCYLKMPDNSYCIVSGVEHSTCKPKNFGIPNKCNDHLTDCKACLAIDLNMLREETERNFGKWCYPKGGYITEFNSSSPVCRVEDIHHL